MGLLKAVKVKCQYKGQDHFGMLYIKFQVFNMQEYCIHVRICFFFRENIRLVKFVKINKLRKKVHVQYVYTIKL